MTPRGALALRRAVTAAAASTAAGRTDSARGLRRLDGFGPLGCGAPRTAASGAAFQLAQEPLRARLVQSAGVRALVAADHDVGGHQLAQEPCVRGRGTAG